MGSTTWVLTREAADAAADVSALRAAGLRAENVPCIECVPQPWPRWDHHGNRVMFLTSRRAAQQFVAAVSDGREQRAGLLLAAMAPATAQVLGPLHPDLTAEGGAVALARALRELWVQRGRPAWNVAYPTSDLGAQAPEQAEALEVLSELGPVERKVVYETRRAATLPTALQHLPDGALGWHFASPSAVNALLASWPEPLAARTRFVVCLGRSTAEAWTRSRRESWPHAILQSGPLPDTLVALERSPS